MALDRKTFPQSGVTLLQQLSFSVGSLSIPEFVSHISEKNISQIHFPLDSSTWNKGGGGMNPIMLGL